MEAVPGIPESEAIPGIPESEAIPGIPESDGMRDFPYSGIPGIGRIDSGISRCQM